MKRGRFALHAIGYSRVSTADQAVEGIGLEAQQARLRAGCQAHHASIQDSRPSRLTRSTRDTRASAERLEHSSAGRVSLSETSDTTTAGTMVFRLLAVRAEFERNLISKRTRTSMAYEHYCRVTRAHHLRSMSRGGPKAEEAYPPAFS